MKLKHSLVFFKSITLAGIVIIAIGSALIYEQMAKNALLTRVLVELQNSINQLVDQEALFLSDRTSQASAEISPLISAYHRHRQAMLELIGHDPVLFDRLSALDSSVNSFTLIYEQILSLQALIGFDKQTGRYGQFRAAAHELQAISEAHNDVAFTLQLLELRRREKDYLLRFDPLYLQLHNDMYAQTVEYLSSKPNEVELVKRLEEYKRNFDTYVEILQKQGLGPSLGLRGESHLAQQAMRLQLAGLSEMLIQYSQRQTETLLWWVLLLMIVLTALSYALLNYLNNRVSLDILQINKTLTDVTKTEDFSLRINNLGHDEIAQVASQIDALLEFIETLLERLRAAQQRLIEEAKMAGLGNMVSGFAHELNTPLGIAITSHSHLKSKIDSLKKDFDDGKLKKQTLSALIEEAEAAISLLENNLMKTASLIEDFKEVAAHQRQDHKIEFQFKRFLFDVLECYQSDLLAPEYHIDIEVPDELYLFSYPSAFNQIYRYALNNCIKHAKIPGKTLNITLSALVINDYVHFYIKDDGYGISKELMPVVFEPFVTSKRNQGGTGLGLSITYNLVTQKLGGQVKMQSLEQGGACLHIILPSSSFILKED